MGEPEQPAEINVRRRLADRIWLRHYLLSHANGAGGGTRSPAARWPRASRDCRPRDRQWRLHCDRPGGGRKIGHTFRKSLGLHRRQRSAARARGRRVQLYGEYMLRCDHGMRADQTAPVQGADAGRESRGQGQGDRRLGANTKHTRRPKRSPARYRSRLRRTRRQRGRGVWRVEA